MLTVIPRKRTPRLREVGSASLDTAIGPYQGESFTLLGLGSVSSIDVIAWLAEWAGGATELFVVTWAIGKSEAHWLRERMGTGCRVRVTMDRGWFNRANSESHEIAAILGDGVLYEAASHCKVYIVRGPNGVAVARSSASITKNARLETWDIDAAADVADGIQAAVEAISRPNDGRRDKNVAASEIGDLLADRRRIVGADQRREAAAADPFAPGGPFEWGTDF
jgi:hypothetical protein